MLGGQGGPHGHDHSTAVRATGGRGRGDAVAGRPAGGVHQRRRRQGRRETGGGRLGGHRHVQAGDRVHDAGVGAGGRLRPPGVVGLRRARARAAHPVHADRHHHRAGLPERPGHVLRGVGRRPDVDVRHPRRREVHRRPAAHGARRGLHPQRHPERRGVRVRPVHDEGGRGHGRHDGGNQPRQAVQRASVHACRHRHRARARLRRLLRRPSHRLGPLHAGAMGQRPAGHPQGEPGLLRRCAEDGARRGGVHGGGRLARGGAVRPGGRGLHGRDVRGQPADGLRPAQLQVGGLARHLAAVRARRRHEEGRRRRTTPPATT